MILRYLKNLFKLETRLESIRKQNFYRIRLLIELYLSKTIDLDLIQLVVDYSYYDAYTFEAMTESQIFKVIWKDCEPYLSSHHVEILFNNILYDTNYNNNIDKESYKYTSIMNFLVEYHKWLSSEYAKNGLVSKSKVESYLRDKVHIQS